jgi:hypothetical protein
MRDRAPLDRLFDEAQAALSAAIRADTAAPPPPRPRSRNDARDWAIAVGRWRDGRTYRSLGAEHGLSGNRVSQITYVTARRWARVHLVGWDRRWDEAMAALYPWWPAPAEGHDAEEA